MISLKELNPHSYSTTPEINANLQTLYTAINYIRQKWGKPMIVTSGLRSEADQLRLINEGKSTASKSKHLYGQAVDIEDADGKLHEWLKSDPKLLVDAKLWCEEGTNGWVHFQIVAPSSGHRWFYP